MTGFKPGDRVHLKHHARTRATTGTVIMPTTGYQTLVQWDDIGVTTPHLTKYLEPLGEPMRQTFPSAASSSDRTLVVDPSGNEAILKIMRGDYYIGGINLDPTQAPALALAILEAAGVEPIPFDEAPETEAGHAAWVLRHHVQESAAKAKEAADRAKLESEAVQLLCKVKGWEVAPFASFGSALQTEALELACFARELHGVTA